LRQLALSIGSAIIAVAPAYAQAGDKDYQRAAAMQNFDKRIAHTEITPHWIDGGNRFWYLDSYQQKRTFVLVDPVRNTREPAFDQTRLAAGLSVATGAPAEADKLPFFSFDFVDAGRAISLSVAGKRLRCSLADYVCRDQPVLSRPGDIVTPDGLRALFVRDDNLWLRDLTSGEESKLTSDGVPGNSYAQYSLPTFDLMKFPAMPLASVSPGSRYALAWRTDVTGVSQAAVVETRVGKLPQVHSYPYSVPGDATLPQATGMLIDLVDRKVVPVKLPSISRILPTEQIARWDPKLPRVAFNEDSRGYKSVKIHVADADSGAIVTPVNDTTDTFIATEYDMQLSGPDLFWTSDRDGWRQLYRFDSRTGALRNRVTHGDWVVRKIIRADPKERAVYFTAGGVARAEDPYQHVLYRIGYDGSGLRRLTPEDADHSIAFSEDGRFFVDTYSRPDLPPVSVLRAADGSLVRELQRADISGLTAAGWRPPERFKAKAADGTTDLYGNIFRPSNFDPAKHYPVIDGIYGGPQGIRSAKSFSDGLGSDAALAELGFIVVTVDGRGTGYRSSAFLNYAYGRMEVAGGLEDHVAVLRQLAALHPEFDLDRAGIYGHSGGGYAAARAILDYPDFFKVAVAQSGNHDQRMFFSAWGERYQGLPFDDKWIAQANASAASRLKGKLLLMHGSLDDVVLMDSTLQLANALIDANKTFDMLILPNRDHIYNDIGAVMKGAPPLRDLYPVRRTWDYFVTNLLGATPPRDFKLERGR
jgi:dipeptidyl aminopeptidase/acylaminoacyl peptidase